MSGLVNLLTAVICIALTTCAEPEQRASQADPSNGGATAWATGTGAIARRVDVLIIADTYDHGSRDSKRSISSGVIGNMKFAEEVARDVTGMPGVSVRTPVKVAGDDFNCDNIRSRVAGFDVGKGDIVFAIYAGHGLHPRNLYEDEPVPRPIPLFTDFDKAKPVMPALYCTTKSGDEPSSVSSASIAESIMRKSPHLVVFIIDSCNEIIGIHSVSSAGPNAGGVSENYPAINVLFTRSSGTAIFVAASVAELAYYDDDGGRFTKQLKQIISDLGRSSEVTWRDVAGKLRPIQTDDGKQTHVQSPYAIILPEPRISP